MICHVLLFIPNISGDTNKRKSNKRSVFYFLFNTLYVQAAVAIESVSFECPKGEYADVNIVKRTYYLVTIVKNNHHLITIPGLSCNMLKFIVYDNGDDDVWLRPWERHDSVGGRGNDVTTIEVTNSNDQVNSDQTHGRAALSMEPPQSTGPKHRSFTDHSDITENLFGRINLKFSK